MSCLSFSNQTSTTPSQPRDIILKNDISPLQVDFPDNRLQINILIVARIMENFFEGVVNIVGKAFEC